MDDEDCRDGLACHSGICVSIFPGSTLIVLDVRISPASIDEDDLVLYPSGPRVQSFIFGSATVSLIRDATQPYTPLYARINGSATGQKSGSHFLYASQRTYEVVAKWDKNYEGSIFSHGNRGQFGFDVQRDSTGQLVVTGYV